jgi:hypothetical protein
VAAARGSVRCGAPHSSSNSRVSLRRRAAPSRNFAALHAAWAPPLLPLLPASQRAAPLSAVRRRLAARCQRHCGSSTACCSSARHGGRSGGSGAAQRSGGAVASPRLHVLRWARRCQRGVRPPQRCRRRRQRHGVRRELSMRRNARRREESARRRGGGSARQRQVRRAAHWQQLSCLAAPPRRATLHAAWALPTFALLPASLRAAPLASVRRRPRAAGGTQRYGVLHQRPPRRAVGAVAPAQCCGGRELRRAWRC